jgi:hypothetical protein
VSAHELTASQSALKGLVMNSHLIPEADSVTSLHPLKLLGLLTLAILGVTTTRAHASSPGGFSGIAATGQVVTSIAAAPSGGFWVQLQDIRSQNAFPDRMDGTYPEFGAPQYDNFASRGNIVADPGTQGYFIVTPDGQIISRGTGRPNLCEGELSNCSGFPSSPTNAQIIVGVAATPTGNGLLALSRNGAVWAAGDAVYFGEETNQKGTVATGIAATLSGKGYYTLFSDGGVFSFGDAVFYGSTGGNKPGGHNLTGMAVSIDSSGQINGYWLVGDDGGVHTFGKAAFWGSTGGNDGGSRVISIVSFPWLIVPGTSPQTEGYAWVHANGAIGAAFRPIDATALKRHRTSDLSE